MFNISPSNVWCVVVHFFCFRVAEGEEEEDEDGEEEDFDEEEEDEEDEEEVEGEEDDEEVSGEDEVKNKQKQSSHYLDFRSVGSVLTCLILFTKEEDFGQDGEVDEEDEDEDEDEDGMYHHGTFPSLKMYLNPEKHSSTLTPAPLSHVSSVSDQITVLNSPWVFKFYFNINYRFKQKHVCRMCWAATSLDNDQ